MSKSNVVVQPHHVETEVINVGYLSWWKRLITAITLKKSMCDQGLWYTLKPQTHWMRTCIKSLLTAKEKALAMDTRKTFFLFRTSFYDDALTQKLRDRAQNGHPLPRVHTLSDIFYAALHTLNTQTLAFHPYIFIVHGEHICNETDISLINDTTDFYILSCYHTGKLMFQRRFLKTDLEEESQSSRAYLTHLTQQKHLIQPDKNQSLPVFVFENESRSLNHDSGLKYVRIPYQINNLIHLILKKLRGRSLHFPHPLRMPHILTQIRKFSLFIAAPSMVCAGVMYAMLPYVLNNDAAAALTEKIEHAHQHTPSFHSTYERDVLSYLHHRHTPYFSKDFFKAVSPILVTSKPLSIQYLVQKDGEHPKHTLSITVQRDHILQEKKTPLTHALQNLPHAYTTSVMKNKILIHAKNR